MMIPRWGLGILDGLGVLSSAEKTAYLMNAATIFTDTLFLNAEGNTDAVFVFQINGALSTSTYSKVILKNGTQVKNVFWEVNGAVGINDYSIFKGTIVCNNGAVSLNTGGTIDERVFTTTGSLSTAAITADMPSGCGGSSSPLITSGPQNQTTCIGDSISFMVTATGNNLTYQWRRGTVNLIDGGNISGSTSSILSINPVSNTNAASNYNVVITGIFAPAVTSSNVSLVVTSLLSPIITSSQPSICTGDSVTLDAGIYPFYNWSNGGTDETITVTSGGTYTVTVSSNSGCNGTGHRTVSIYSPPVPHILSSGLSNLCNGGFASLWVGASFSAYNWSTGAATQLISINTGGTYTVTVTNTNGCLGTTSITLNNSTCNSPLGLFTTNIAGISATGNWTLAPCYYNYSIRISLANANTWTTYTLASNTHYTFSGLARNTAYDWQIRTNCNNTQTMVSAWSVSQTFTTLAHRIEDRQTNSTFDLNIYPNHANHAVTIAFSIDIEGSYVLKLTDMIGNNVKSEIGSAGLGENTYIMNLEGIAKGIYVFELIKGTSISKLKLVIQ